MGDKSMSDIWNRRQISGKSNSKESAMPNSTDKVVGNEEHPRSDKMEKGVNTGPEKLDRFLDIVYNISSIRRELIAKLTDPRRDIDVECGHPSTGTLTADKYHQLYDRDPIAARVIELMPKECWQVTPEITETQDGERNTPFEEAWDNLGRQLRSEQSYYQDEQGSVVWEYLRRADILSGIGQFGVILLGIDDGLPLSEPAHGVDSKDSTDPMYDDTKGSKVQPANPAQGVPTGADAQYSQSYAYGVTSGLHQSTTGTGVGEIGAALSPPGSHGEDKQGTDTKGSSLSQKTSSGDKDVKGTNRKLLFLRVFPESLAQITRFETDPRSPRYGQPIQYLITFNDPNAGHNSGVGLTTSTQSVHWTRVIHLADNMSASEVFGVPRCRVVLNNILDLQKLYGGSAEIYWRGAFPGLSVETHPQLGGDVEIDKVGLEDQVENYMNGLQRALTLMGMSAKSLAPQVVDPTPQIKVHLEAIAIKLSCPIRVFIGSERGELASSQDDSDWNGRVADRENGYLTPRVIVPFVDRLIWLGILPTPKGYSVVWPDLDSKTDKDKAGIAALQTTAMVQYIAGGGESLITPHDFLVHILQMTDEVAEAIIESIGTGTPLNKSLIPTPQGQGGDGIDSSNPTKSTEGAIKKDLGVTKGANSIGGVRPTTIPKGNPRDLKPSINERLVQVLNEWSDAARDAALEARKAHGTHKLDDPKLGHSATTDPNKAKFIGKKVGKDEHVHAHTVEHEIAGAVDGKVISLEKGKYSYRDVDTGKHAIEVKSLLKGEKQSISVHDDALLRKVKGISERDKEHIYHTVAVDERATYAGGEFKALYSGNRLYYKRGSGRYTLKQIHEVKDAEELKKLVHIKDHELPEKARGTLPSGKTLETLKVNADKASISRRAKDKARKERIKAGKAADKSKDTTES